MATIKQIFPHLDKYQRILIGRRFIASYMNTHGGGRPAKIQEDEFQVYDYPVMWIKERMTRIKKSFQKKYPQADLRQPERVKRERIKVTHRKIV